jgi:hypothetical protein
VIDGNENIYFRAISGDTRFHTNTVSGFVYLSAGKHQVKVEYRSQSTSSVAFEDWNIAALEINY